MAIVELDALLSHIGLTLDNGPELADLAQSKADAAQAHIERWLGFKIEETFGGADQEPVPEDLKEAVLQLAAWWFDNREAATENARQLPFGVADIITGYRGWTF